MSIRLTDEWLAEIAALPRSHDVITLIDEIRRLQELMKRVEWSATAGYIGGERACPWCYGHPEYAVGGQRHGHEPRCPAFGSGA